MKARHLIETEEWKVQPVAENASAETVVANGMSAIHTGDAATAEKMLTLLEKKANAASGAPASGGAHAGHGAPPAAATGDADEGKSVRAMHKQLAALVAEAKGQMPQAIALVEDAVRIEESMRPPNGAANPVKPSHELLGEVLLRAGRPADAAKAFDTALLRMPNRARSLIGSARAHAAAGHRELSDARWTTLQTFWKGGPIQRSTSR
jgi:hypothetical protein